MMSAGEENPAALAQIPSLALTKAGAKSLAARGRADLRIREEAEELLNKGRELNRQQRYEEALLCLVRGTQLSPNHPKLLLLVGVMYDQGHGVPQDHMQAAAWYRRAAEQGSALAQDYLGQAYLRGRGVPQDNAQAAVWHRKAAEQGLAQAQGWLAYFYRYGIGVPQDDKLSELWMRKARDQRTTSGETNQAFETAILDCLADQRTTSGRTNQT
jgi:TPR repeat protein